MAKRKVIWSTNSSLDMIAIMEFYNNKNKSKIYSSRLYKEINLKLKTLDFSVALPKKTSDKKLFYFSHNHIFIGFDIQDNTLIAQLVIDDRRNPELIEKLLNFIE
jgi:hypothetical protein